MVVRKEWLASFLSTSYIPFGSEIRYQHPVREMQTRAQENPDPGEKSGDEGRKCVGNAVYRQTGASKCRIGEIGSRHACMETVSRPFPVNGPILPHGLSPVLKRYLQGQYHPQYHNMGELLKLLKLGWDPVLLTSGGEPLVDCLQTWLLVRISLKANG